VNRFRYLCAFAAVGMTLLSGCSSPHGQPRQGSETLAPNEILEFGTLYAENCSGCHGADGRGGAAISIADPVFLAIVDDATIRRTATNGVRGTPMPAFAQSAGGMLTEKQIDAIVRGIRSWAKPDALRGVAAPSFTPQAAGDPHRGADVYRTYCASCHGVDGRGGEATSIVDGSYLALVSDQELRLNVILGRPAQGAPDWRGDIPGRPLSEQEVSDVVAWLAAQRPTIPGQPYPSSASKRTAGGIQ
jgi:cytochrome c oxidase cbb3-type subunit 3